MKGPESKRGWRSGKNIALGVTFAATVIGLGAWLFFRVPEPEYEGRGLGDYLSSSTSTQADVGRVKAAVDGTGPAGIRYLAAEMQVSAWMEQWMKWHPSLPAPVRELLPDPGKNQRRRRMASVMLMLSGTNGVSALPGIARVLERPANGFGVRVNCVRLAGRLAPGTKYEERVIRGLLQVLQADRSPHMRSPVYTALGAFGDRAELVVPVLIDGLREGETTREACVKSLKRIGAPAIPMLEAAAAAEEEEYQGEGEIPGTERDRERTPGLVRFALEAVEEDLDKERSREPAEVE